MKSMIAIGLAVFDTENVIRRFLDLVPF